MGFFRPPSITETIAKAGFDFIAIDMEHSTINQAEAQRIIAASQAEGVLAFLDLYLIQMII